ncbi:CoA transferase [Escherichia coli]
MGARVIKVQPPGHGDDTRTFGPYVDGQSLYYSFINHGKESVVLDLKNDHDKSIFINMLKQADVLAENFRPGTMEKLGFSWETLQKLTRASYMLHRQVSDIPVRPDAPAYDTIIQAMSGIMMETGYPTLASARWYISCGSMRLVLIYSAE